MDWFEIYKDATEDLYAKKEEIILSVIPEGIDLIPAIVENKLVFRRMQNNKYNTLYYLDQPLVTFSDIYIDNNKFKFDYKIHTEEES